MKVEVIDEFINSVVGTSLMICNNPQEMVKFLASQPKLDIRKIESFIANRRFKLHTPNGEITLLSSKDDIVYMTLGFRYQNIGIEYGVFVEEDTKDYLIASLCGVNNTMYSLIC